LAPFSHPETAQIRGPQPVDNATALTTASQQLTLMPARVRRSVGVWGQTAKHVIDKHPRLCFATWETVLTMTQRSRLFSRRVAFSAHISLRADSVSTHFDFVHEICRESLMLVCTHLADGKPRMLSHSTAGSSPRRSESWRRSHQGKFSTQSINDLICRAARRDEDATLSGREVK
jgi:hypothetical protein